MKYLEFIEKLKGIPAAYEYYERQGLSEIFITEYLQGYNLRCIPALGHSAISPEAIQPILSVDLYTLLVYFIIIFDTFAY
jgi:hypothetical protein